MPIHNAYITCDGCSRSLNPALFGYPGALCGDCELITRRALVDQVRANMMRDFQAQQSVRSRRAADRTVAYLQTGKRCTFCHDFKAPSAFHKCARTGDGLQPGCIACNKLRVQTQAQGGRPAWHKIRDIFRAHYDAKHAGTVPADQPSA